MKYIFILLIVLVASTSFAQYKFNVGDTVTSPARDTLVIMSRGGNSYEFRLMRGNTLFSTKKSADRLLDRYQKIAPLITKAPDVQVSLNCPCDSAITLLNNLVGSVFVISGNQYVIAYDSDGQLVLKMQGPVLPGILPQKKTIIKPVPKKKK